MVYVNPDFTPVNFALTGTTFRGASIEFVACGSAASLGAAAVPARLFAPGRSICAGAAAAVAVAIFTNTRPDRLSRATNFQKMLKEQTAVVR